MRMLRYALGVNPAELALLPDEQGWVKFKELLAALHGEEGWRGIRQAMIEDVAGRVAKDTFEIDGNRIRCKETSYAQPDYEAVHPAHLYYGARRKAYPVIKKNGLSAGDDGRPVILAADKDRALAIGRRRDAEPVLVTVQAGQASEQGAVFPAWGDEGLFLCDWADASFIMGPPLPEKPLPKTQSKDKKKEVATRLEQQNIQQPHEPPGSFTLTHDDVEKPYKRKGLRKEISWKNERRKDRRKDH